MKHVFKVNGSTQLELNASSPLEDALFHALLADPKQLEVVKQGNSVVIRKRVAEVTLDELDPS
jgi:hypothetical protein